MSALAAFEQDHSAGTSNYNSLQATLKLKSWHGLTGQFAYTLAHSIDEVTEYRGVIPHDSFNLALDYANSDFDTRHNFTTFLSYEIPGSSLRTQGAHARVDGQHADLGP